MTDPQPPPASPWAAPVAPAPVPPSDAPPSDAPLPPSWGQTKPPRPPCLVGALLMIVAAVPIAVGSFLTWYEIPGLPAINGFTQLDGEVRDGPTFVAVAAVLLGFGITTLAAKRILPIAILAIVFASFGFFGSVADLSEINELQGLFEGIPITTGPGLPIVLVGSLIGLAGGIVALATRRR